MQIALRRYSSPLIVKKRYARGGGKLYYFVVMTGKKKWREGVELRKMLY
jgi:hypothetical protein